MACYKCDSHNYSDPNCDDPIHPAYMKLEDNCQVPKQNHIGTFPAAFCVKIIGESENVYLLDQSVPTLIYSTRAIISRSRSEAGLVFKPRILSLKKESINNGSSEEVAAFFPYFFTSLVFYFTICIFYPLGTFFLSDSKKKKRLIQ